MIKTKVTKTSGSKNRQSFLAVKCKNPAFEYCFRRKEDIESGGGMDMYGYTPVQPGNSDSEEWDVPKTFKAHSAGKRISHLDVVLCRRPIETAMAFKQMENEKYNAYANFLRTSTENANIALRKLDVGAVVVNESQNIEKTFTQRAGTTEKKEE